MENENLASVTALPTRSTAKLDLANPPDRLTDAQLAEARRIAHAPLPPLAPVEPKYLAQCLRMMLAVLPRQNADDVAGELFVAAYKRHLGGYPQEAIEYLTDRATGECRWFPTIAECLEIIRGWRRSDNATARQRAASALVQAETAARADERRRDNRPITQAEIDKMPDEMRQLGVQVGAIVRTGDGGFAPA